MIWIHRTVILFWCWMSVTPYVGMAAVRRDGPSLYLYDAETAKSAEGMGMGCLFIRCVFNLLHRLETCKLLNHAQAPPARDLYCRSAIRQLSPPICPTRIVLQVNSASRFPTPDPSHPSTYLSALFGFFTRPSLIPETSEHGDRNYQPSSSSLKTSLTVSSWDTIFCSSKLS